MRKSLLFIVPLILLFASGCSITLHSPWETDERGPGNTVTEQRDVTGFDRVEFGSVGTLTITQGNQESLTIEAADNLIDHIETRVVNGELVIGFESNFHLNLPTNIHYTLVVKDLSSVLLSGVGSLEIGSLKTDALTINLSGTGNLTFDDLQADSLTVDISGLGGAEIDGHVKDLDVQISGAGNFKGGNLYSETSRVQVSGLGNATLWVNELLDVTISGTGNVNYFGQPRITQTISGLGRVINLGSR